MNSFWIIIILVSITSTNVINEPIQFIDTRLKEKIENILKVTNPTQEDMLNLTELEATDITDLSGLEYAKNLTRLRIDNTIFRRIPYTDNRIEDISALSSLHALISLELIRNRITDILPLKSLSNLKKLNLKENRINDISSLSSLSNLEKLNLASNSLSDISALSVLSNLKWLELQWNRIHDINALSSLTELELLNLRGNNISDIYDLSDLTKLKRLNLSENQISDIIPLSSMENLSRLSLKFNKVSDTSVLSSLPNLQDVDITNNPYYLKRFLFITGGIVGAVVIVVIVWRLYLNKYKPDKKRLYLRTKFSIICSILAPFLCWFCFEHIRNLLSYEALYSRNAITNNNLFLFGPMVSVLVAGFISAISVLIESERNQKYTNSRPATLTALFLLVIVSVLCCLYLFFYFVLRYA